MASRLLTIDALRHPSVKMQRRLKKALLPSLLLLCTTNASAWRCGSALVETGDYQKDVLADCGKPAARYSQQVSYDLDIGEIHKRRRYKTIAYWVYLPGPNKFARILYFEDSVLKSLRSGSYSREYQHNRANCLRENVSIRLDQTKPEIKLRCGPPDTERKVEEYSAAVVLDHRNRVFENMVVDEWTYTDNDTVWVYRFENGVLKWRGEKDRETDDRSP